MKILIVTQKIDKHDPVLGFFHRWVEEFARHFEYITVICLYAGEYSLPNNVKVLSLGKEHKQSRISYVNNFYKYIFAEWKNYDRVFIHMNQEYILLAGLLWRLGSKQVTMWRNHHAGNWLTYIAASLCTKMFCTSKYSFTARFKKTVLMPVGIDTHIFSRIDTIPKKRNVLFLARISPVKKPDILLQAIALLQKKGKLLTTSIYGDPLPKDQDYYDSLKKYVEDNNLSSLITFEKGIPNTETVSVYNAHDIFVNLSTSGMYDKTIFEAAATESLFLASNRNLEGEVPSIFIFEEGNVEELAAKLEYLMDATQEERKTWGKTLRAYVEEKHSLDLLAQKLEQQLS